MRQFQSRKLTRFAVLLATLLTSFLLISSINHGKSFYLHRWFGNFSVSGFMYAFEKENHYFAQNYFQDNPPDPFVKMAFSFLTNLQLNDMRSFIRNEIPGYAHYYANILIAGEGTDLTNIPNEQDLSIEELEQEPTVDKSAVEKYAGENTTPSTNGKKVMFIYHSHNRESFFALLPDANRDNPNAASSSKANISLLGERLKKKLEENGIGATNDKTDIGEMLLQKDLNYSKSYQVSRDVVASALHQNEDIQYLIDIHRDNQRKEITTKTINGENFARLYFIVGMENKNHEESLQLATTLHNALEKKYKGISRGVFPKDYSQGNGIYNQDLSTNALLVEIGGVDNTIEELYRTVDALAEVLSEFYWQAEKVNG